MLSRNERLPIVLEELLRAYCRKRGYRLSLSINNYIIKISFYYGVVREYTVDLTKVDDILNAYEAIIYDFDKVVGHSPRKVKEFEEIGIKHGYISEKDTLDVKMKRFIKNAYYGLCSSKPMPTLAFPSDLITNVIFNDPATIVFWIDGTKTVVKTQDGEAFDPEKGLAMAISKRLLGNNGSYYNYFRKWLDIYEEKDV